MNYSPARVLYEQQQLVAAENLGGSQNELSKKTFC
jgi:hypothetical protein